MNLRKKKYWSNVLAMLGVALVATAFFAKENWIWGMALGAYALYWGAKLAEELNCILHYNIHSHYGYRRRRFSRLDKIVGK